VVEGGILTVKLKVLFITLLDLERLAKTKVFAINYHLHATNFTTSEVVQLHIM